MTGKSPSARRPIRPKRKIAATIPLLAMTLLLLPLTAGSIAASPATGTARAIDGDSLKVGEQEVRLFGIDAPELAQRCTRGGQTWTCGAAAAEQLAKLIAGQTVRCASVGTDRYGRMLARCRAGETDLNRVMVASGFALAYRRYSMDYVAAEESAKAARRGMWTGEFQLPSDLRHGEDDHLYAPARPGRSERSVAINGSKPQPNSNCRIKGNHSRRGEKIYHLPGMPYYAQTVAEEIFCSEGQARAAGYRRSRADQQR